MTELMVAVSRTNAGCTHARRDANAPASVAGGHMILAKGPT